MTVERHGEDVGVES